MKALTTHNINRPRPLQRPGVTLVEMMVAVGITILMMMATSVVFKSAGAAAGKANSSSEIMQQARALCRQLENDFKGLRPDMPMAVIFETEDPANLNSPRQDRIVFFANGDFQTTGNESGNLARIFYGQAREGFETPQHLDNLDAPLRRVLARRYKIMSPSGYPPANDISCAGTWSGCSPEGYDDELLENSNESFWKTEDPQNFVKYHFMTWDGGPPSPPPIPPGPVDTGWKCSMVRRPEVVEIEGNLGADALQQLYILPDVSDFRIEAWYEYLQGWGQITVSPTAIYWNIEDIDGNLMAPQPIPDMNWLSEHDIAAYIASLGAPQPVIMWPKALRFTFTLYDRDRRYFPDGKAFTYIVKLPKR